MLIISVMRILSASAQNTYSPFAKRGLLNCRIQVNPVLVQWHAAIEAVADALEKLKYPHAVGFCIGHQHVHQIASKSR